MSLLLFMLSLEYQLCLRGADFRFPKIEIVRVALNVMSCQIQNVAHTSPVIPSVSEWTGLAHGAGCE